MTLRWGLVGTARIHRRLIPAMRAARRSTIAAVASRDAARAEAHAREWEIPRSFGSYEALLHDPQVDAVYIALPNALHVEWTLRALDAGKHVLCEKPLALAGADVERIDAIARARNLVAVEGFMYRHEPLTTRILELVRDGSIGPVEYINSGFTYRRSRDNDVRLDPALGGGSLWDVGCYPVSLTRLIAGNEPEEVVGWAQYGPSGVDETFTAALRFPSLTAAVHCSFTAEWRMWIEITGRDAALRVSRPFRPEADHVIELTRGEDVHTVPVPGSPLLFVRMVEDFVAAVLDGRPPALSLADSRGNALTLAALHESARDGVPKVLRAQAV